MMRRKLQVQGEDPKVKIEVVQKTVTMKSKNKVSGKNTLVKGKMIVLGARENQMMKLIGQKGERKKTAPTKPVCLEILLSNIMIVPVGKRVTQEVVMAMVNIKAPKQSIRSAMILRVHILNLA